MSGLLCLLALGAVLRTALLAPPGAGRVEGTADHVVADTGEVFDASAADQDHRVLLQVVADARNVGGHLLAGGQPHPGHLAELRGGRPWGRGLDGPGAATR